MDEVPQVAARGAVEALRAGVPNRAAIRLLGEHNGALVNPFLDILGRCARDLDVGRPVRGNLVWGGFGAGKSHLLGYMRERVALRQDGRRERLRTLGKGNVGVAGLQPTRPTAACIDFSISPSVSRHRCQSATVLESECAAGRADRDSERRWHDSN